MKIDKILEEFKQTIVTQAEVYKRDIHFKENNGEIEIYSGPPDMGTKRTGSILTKKDVLSRDTLFEIEVLPSDKYTYQIAMIFRDGNYRVKKTLAPGVYNEFFDSDINVVYSHKYMRLAVEHLAGGSNSLLEAIIL